MEAGSPAWLLISYFMLKARVGAKMPSHHHTLSSLALYKNNASSVVLHWMLKCMTSCLPRQGERSDHKLTLCKSHLHECRHTAYNWMVQTTHVCTISPFDGVFVLCLNCPNLWQALSVPWSAAVTFVAHTAYPFKHAIYKRRKSCMTFAITYSVPRAR